jgi:predicted phosphodiesterase
MLIRLLSDLHQEFKPFNVQPLDEDKETVLVLAGDIHVGDAACDFVAEQAENFAHVIYVLGNHEYYHHDLHYLAEDIRYVLDDVPNASLLDNDSAVIGDVRFLGTTLWTDMNNADPVSMFQIEKGLNDYYCITNRSQIIRAMDTITLFRRNFGWLDTELSLEHHGPNVVVTHHLPSEKSISPLFDKSGLNGAYASNCEKLMYDHDIAYWFHGHTHHSMSYEVEGCKVRCNPFGYAGRDENLHFDPTFRIEV